MPIKWQWFTQRFQDHRFCLHGHNKLLFRNLYQNHTLIPTQCGCANISVKKFQNISLCARFHPHFSAFIAQILIFLQNPFGSIIPGSGKNTLIYRNIFARLVLSDLGPYKARIYRDIFAQFQANLLLLRLYLYQRMDFNFHNVCLCHL